MKALDAHKLSDRLDRFFRWFFTASPTHVVEPRRLDAAPPRSRTVSQRESPPLRARHSGPVRVAVKAKS
jgi:hypothetical protein